MTKEIDNSMIRMPKELQAKLKKLKKYKIESYSHIIERLLRKEEESKILSKGGCEFCSKKVTAVFRGTQCCSNCFQKLKGIVKSKRRDFENE